MSVVFGVFYLLVFLVKEIQKFFIQAFFDELDSGANLFYPVVAVPAAGCLIQILVCCALRSQG